MNKRFTRAANAANKGNKKLPQPKRLEFTPHSTPKGSSTPQTSPNKKKNKTPKVNTPATNSTATENSVPTESETKNSIPEISETPQAIPSPNSSSSDTEDSTMAARVPFPTFKTDDIEAWFRRVEYWFTFSKVTTEADKFALIASQIENPTVTNLPEMLTPDANTPYTNARKKIITIFETSTSAKINNLLSGCKLGDLKPSQLLAEMKRLGGSVGDEILRNLWSKRLPLHVQTVVAAATKSTLDEVAAIADAVIDVVATPSATMNQVTTSNNQLSLCQENQSARDNEFENLSAAVNQLTKSFREMQSDRSRSKSRDNQKNRDRSGSNKPAENRI